MSPSKHVSTFELDVFFAATPAELELPPNPAVAAHVAACEACRAYLDSLASLDPPRPAVEPHALAPAASASSRVSRFPSRSMPDRPAASLLAPMRARAIASVAAVFAFAACVALFVRSKTIASEEAAYIGVKGTPDAQILVRREGVVAAWDGIAAVRRGDALALSLACEEFAYVTVVTGDPPFRRAWEGDCPRKGTPLPFTLVVDGEPGREHFSLVFSHGPVDDTRLTSLVAERTRDPHAWTIDFFFEKEER